MVAAIGAIIRFFIFFHTTIRPSIKPRLPRINGDEFINLHLPRPNID
jgi:hypothetical protein